jgi:hypothetical protein|tara:strand:+ start:166 stop:387 length:222 start_codon:yes stop_codon:yes gene_type:complete
MPDKYSFYNPVDRWSTTVEQARLHADFHAEPEPPEYDHYDIDDDEDVEYDEDGEPIEYDCQFCHDRFCDRCVG